MIRYRNQRVVVDYNDRSRINVAEVNHYVDTATSNNEENIPADVEVTFDEAYIFPDGQRASYEINKMDGNSHKVLTLTAAKKNGELSWFVAHSDDSTFLSNMKRELKAAEWTNSMEADEKEH